MTEEPLVTEEQENKTFYNSDEIKEHMRTNMDFFCSLVLPEEIFLLFPAFYTWLWENMCNALIKDRDFSKFAVGLPRGHAKTMVVKFLLLWAILFTKKRYILIVGANTNKARAIVADVCTMLASPTVVKLFGHYQYDMEQDTQDIKKFKFCGRDVILEAAGTGTAIRGASHKFARPDIIVCDDTQTSDCAESLAEAERYHQWFTGTLMKAKSPFGCTYIYIGNMYRDLEVRPQSGVFTCMLRNLQRSPSWQSFIVGGILGDGTALWEDLQPLEQLLSEYQDDLALGMEEVFAAEVLNDPSAKSNRLLDANRVTEWNPLEQQMHQGNFIVIDPATSKATPDQMVIAYFEVFDNRAVLMDAEIGKFTGPESVHKAIDFGLKHNCRLILPEAVAYQYTLGQWFTYVCEQRGIEGFIIEPLYNHGSKLSRIMRSFLSVHKGEIMFTKTMKALYVHQGQQFKPTKSNNIDDLLDTVEMGHRVATTMQHLLAEACYDQFEDSGAIGVDYQNADTPISF